MKKKSDLLLYKGFLESAQTRQRNALSKPIHISCSNVKILILKGSIPCNYLFGMGAVIKNVSFCVISL